MGNNRIYFHPVLKNSKGRKHSAPFWIHINFFSVFKLGTHIPDYYNFSWDFYFYLQIDLLY